jgi:tetratricopeptide (TPR) repeat protein
MKMKLVLFAALVLFSISAATVFAQDKNDVIKAYNEGAKASQTDVPAAIAAFENVITLSDKVGESAADLKQKAVNILPQLYYKLAKAALTDKKPAAEVIRAAKTASAQADKLGNKAYKENSDNLLIQGYNLLANEFYGKNDYANALIVYDSVLMVNPVYSSAQYNKALIYAKQNNADGFEKSIDGCLEALKAKNDTNNIKQASKMALEYFRSGGSKASQANKLDDAINLLNKAAKYGEDKDLCYYFADVYNKQKNFDKGAECAKKGLDMETGAPEAKAKFYFQLATAQLGKGQKDDACASFKNAMFGPFAEPSKVQRANLKCQ